MLPNHAPMVIAEQFGTLAELFPGRIDLGLGRAPGTDQRTLRALRVDPMEAEDFPRDVLELQAFLAPPEPGQTLRAVPGAGTEGAALDPGLQPLRRAARRHAGPALRLRLAFRPRRADPGASGLSRGLQAVGPAGQAPCDRRAERRGRPDRRGGADALHLGQQRAVGMVRGPAWPLPPPIPTSRPSGHGGKGSCLRACSPARWWARRRRSGGLARFVAETGVDEVIVASASSTMERACAPTRSSTRSRAGVNGSPPDERSRRPHPRCGRPSARRPSGASRIRDRARATSCRCRSGHARRGPASSRRCRFRHGSR